MTTRKTLLTADEFYDFCYKNEGRYELVRGEVIELSPVNDEHSEIALSTSALPLMYTPASTASAGREWKLATYYFPARTPCAAPMCLSVWFRAAEGVSASVSLQVRRTSP